MRIAANVTNGLIVEHTVRDLFLTESHPNRASYLFEITSMTAVSHTIIVLGQGTVIKCDNRHEEIMPSNARQLKLCAINPHQATIAYQIVLSEI